MLQLTTSIAAACLVCCINPLQVEEAEDVLTNFNALLRLAETPVLRDRRKQGWLDCAAFIIGDTELKDTNSNKFTLKQVLDATLPPLQLIQRAITTMEANRAQLSIAEAMWRTLKEELAELGNALQQSRRGRGAAAAEERRRTVEALVEVRTEAAAAVADCCCCWCRLLLLLLTAGVVAAAAAASEAPPAVPQQQQRAGCAAGPCQLPAAHRRRPSQAANGLVQRRGAGRRIY